MRKEIIYAIAGGIILGLIIAFGVYRISAMSNKNNKINLATPTPQSNAIGEFKIVLDKPSEGDVVTQNFVNVSGLTKPLFWVTLSGEKGDYTIQSNAKGEFSQDVDLIAGVNQIKATAFEASGKESITQVLVVYSENFQLKTIPSASPEGTATETSDVRQKVAQDVANALNSPKAYIGTVTDITDSTLEIKTSASTIEQISVSAGETTVINSTGTSTKTVKVTDIAIGDFIVAMGYVDGNSVLDAQRILITTPIAQDQVTASIAKIISVTKKALNVSVLPDSNEITVQPGSNTDIFSFKDGKTTDIKLGSISADDIIIYVTGTDSKGNETVRSIFRVVSSQG